MATDNTQQDLTRHIEQMCLDVLISATNSKELQKHTKNSHDEVLDIVNRFWCVDGEEDPELYNLGLRSMKDVGTPDYPTGFEAKVDEFLAKLEEGEEHSFSQPGDSSQTLPKDLLEEKELTDFSYSFTRNCSFLTLNFLPHIGFDEIRLKSKEFSLWLGAQPPVNDRKVTIERLVSPQTSSQGTGGLLDVLVGKNLSHKKHNKKSHKEHSEHLSTFAAQDCSIGLYALDHVSMNDEEQASSQGQEVGIESMLINLVGDGADCNGVVSTCRSPRGVKPEDFFVAIFKLTGVDVANKIERYNNNLTWKQNGYQLCLVGFELLIMAYDSFEIGVEGKDDQPAIQRLIRMYHVLYCSCGFPTVDDGNEAAHRYLIFRSFPELYARIIYMNAKILPVRSTCQNGQGRITAFRQAVTSSVPSGKPLSRLSSSHTGSYSTYFDSINKSKWVNPDKVSSGTTSYTQSFLLPLLATRARTTVFLPNIEDGPGGNWYQSVQDLLLSRSKKDLLALDQAASKGAIDIVKDAVSVLQLPENRKEVCYLAEKKGASQNDDGNSDSDDNDSDYNDGSDVVVKEPWLQQHQVLWISSAAVRKHHNSAVMKQTVTANLGSTITSILKHDEIKKAWTKCNENEQKKINKLKSKCKGYDTAHIYMLCQPGQFGRSTDDLTDENLPKTVEEILKEENLDLFRGVLFSKVTIFPNQITQGFQAALGKISLPELYGLVAMLCGLLCYNDKSTAVAYSFVNNNGCGAKTPKDFVTLGKLYSGHSPPWLTDAVPEAVKFVKRVLLMPAMHSALRVKVLFDLQDKRTQFFHRSVVAFASNLAELHAKHGHLLPINRKMESKAPSLYNFLTCGFESIRVKHPGSKADSKTEGEYKFSSLNIVTNVPVAHTLVFVLHHSDVPVELHWKNKTMEKFIGKCSKKTKHVKEEENKAYALEWREHWLPCVRMKSPAVEASADTSSQENQPNMGPMSWSINDFIEMLLAVDNEEPCVTSKMLWELIEGDESTKEVLLDPFSKFDARASGKTQKGGWSKKKTKKTVASQQDKDGLGKIDSNATKEEQNKQAYDAAVEQLSKATKVLSHYVAAESSADYNLLDELTKEPTAAREAMTSAKKAGGRRSKSSKSQVTSAVADEESDEESSSSNSADGPNNNQGSEHVGRAMAHSIVGYLTDRMRNASGNGLTTSQMREQVMSGIDAKVAYEKIAGCKVDDESENNDECQECEDDGDMSSKQITRVLCPYEANVSNIDKDKQILALKRERDELQQLLERERSKLSNLLVNSNSSGSGNHDLELENRRLLQGNQKLYSLIKQQKYDIDELNNQLALQTKDNNKEIAAPNQQNLLLSPHKSMVEKQLQGFDLKDEAFAEQVLRVLVEHGHAIPRLLKTIERKPVTTVAMRPEVTSPLGSPERLRRNLTQYIDDEAKLGDREEEEEEEEEEASADHDNFPPLAFNDEEESSRNRGSGATDHSHNHTKPSDDKERSNPNISHTKAAKDDKKDQNTTTTSSSGSSGSATTKANTKSAEKSADGRQEAESKKKANGRAMEEEEMEAQEKEAALAKRPPDPNTNVPISNPSLLSTRIRTICEESDEEKAIHKRNKRRKITECVNPQTQNPSGLPGESKPGTDQARVDADNFPVGNYDDSLRTARELRTFAPSAPSAAAPASQSEKEPKPLKKADQKNSPAVRNNSASKDSNQKRKSPPTGSSHSKNHEVLTDGKKRGRFNSGTTKSTGAILLSDVVNGNSRISPVSPQIAPKKSPGRNGNGNPSRSNKNALSDIFHNATAKLRQKNLERNQSSQKPNSSVGTPRGVTRKTTPNTASSRKQPPKASSSQKQPPKASSSRKQPPKASSSRKQPPKASSSQKQPPKASSSQKQPPKATPRNSPKQQSSPRKKVAQEEEYRVLFEYPVLPGEVPEGTEIQFQWPIPIPEDEHRLTNGEVPRRETIYAKSLSKIEGPMWLKDELVSCMVKQLPRDQTVCMITSPAFESIRTDLHPTAKDASPRIKKSKNLLKTDPSSTKMILFVINETNTHYYSICVVNPAKVANLNLPTSALVDKDCWTGIIIMDSFLLPGTPRCIKTQHEKDAEDIRVWLDAVYSVMNGTFNKESCPVVWPQCPTQPNCDDCSLYSVCAIRDMFRLRNHVFDPQNDEHNWFLTDLQRNPQNLFGYTQQDIDGLRKYIAQHFRDLAAAVKAKTAQSAESILDIH